MPGDDGKIRQRLDTAEERGFGVSQRTKVNLIEKGVEFGEPPVFVEALHFIGHLGMSHLALASAAEALVRRSAQLPRPNGTDPLPEQAVAARACLGITVFLLNPSPRARSNSHS